MAEKKKEDFTWLEVHLINDFCALARTQET